MSFNYKRYAEIRTGLVSCSFVLLLSAYLASTIELKGLHSFFHEHEQQALHSAAHEKDSCHRTIYHQEKSSGCHHKSHLTEYKKCAFCHYTFHPDQLLNKPRHNTAHQLPQLRKADISFLGFACHPPLLKSRAPPAMYY